MKLIKVSTNIYYLSIGNTRIYFSYAEPVAMYEFEKQQITYSCSYLTKTTAKHINEILALHSGIARKRVAQSDLLDLVALKYNIYS